MKEHNNLDDKALSWSASHAETERLASAFLKIELGRFVRDVRRAADRAHDAITDFVFKITDLF